MDQTSLKEDLAYTNTRYSAASTQVERVLLSGHWLNEQQDSWSFATCLRLVRLRGEGNTKRRLSECQSILRFVIKGQAVTTSRVLVAPRMRLEEPVTSTLWLAVHRMSLARTLERSDTGIYVKSQLAGNHFFRYWAIPIDGVNEFSLCKVSIQKIAS